MWGKKLQSKPAYEIFSYLSKPPLYSCIIREDGDRSSQSMHKDGKTDEDVKIYMAFNFKKFPRGITERFKNVHTLMIQDAKFSEINREDFDGFEKLKEFYVSGAPNLRCLNGDIFDDLKELESFGFNETKISSINENFLSKQKNLKMAHILNSPVMNAAFVDTFR